MDCCRLLGHNVRGIARLLTGNLFHLTFVVRVRCRKNKTESGWSETVIPESFLSLLFMRQKGVYLVLVERVLCLPL